MYALETMLFVAIIALKSVFDGQLLVKKNRRVRCCEPADALPYTRLNNGTKFITTKLVTKMKKYLFFFFLLAVGAMSCQKDIEQGSITSEVTPTDTKQTSLFDQTKPVENDDVYIKIDAFKAKLAKIEAGTLPENDNGTSVGDAIWNIEALLNSQYAQAEKSFAKLARATNTIRVALNDDGTVNNSALLTAVNQSRQSLSSQYHALTDAEKHVVTIDIRKKEPQTESERSVLLEVEGIYGLRDCIALDYFGPDDFWHWGFGLGTCDGPPTQRPLDAATEIGKKLNYRTPAQRQAVLFYTNQEVKFIVGSTLSNTNDVTPDDNIRDTRMFSQRRDLANYNLYECLDPSDMNFYLDGTRWVIGFVAPSGKGFISIDLFGDAVFPSEDIMHNAYTTYGIPHYRQSPLLTL